MPGRAGVLFCVVRGIYREGLGQTVAAYRREGKRIAGFGFLELLLGDFIGITQAITIFSSDVEWMLDTALEMKTASLYINEYTEYLA